MMNIFSFQLTDGSTLKAASSIFLDVDLRSRMLRHTRLTMEPFQKSQQIMWLLFQFVPTELEVNGGVSGGASHKFNAIRHGRETTEITKVEKLQKSPKSKNCTNCMQSFNLGARMRTLCRWINLCL